MLTSGSVITRRTLSPLLNTLIYRSLLPDFGHALPAGSIQLPLPTTLLKSPLLVRYPRLIKMGREAKACYVLIFFLYFLSALLFGLSFHPSIRSTGSQGPCWALSAALFVVSSVVGLIVCCLSDGCGARCCGKVKKSKSRKITAHSKFKTAKMKNVEFDMEKNAGECEFGTTYLPT